MFYNYSTTILRRILFSSLFDRDAMLTTVQKAQIRKGFAIGFSDTHIARVVPDVNHMQVYNYRHKLGIPTEEIVKKRYDIWTRLIYEGLDISQIAEIYNVTEQSVKVLLWKNRNFSFVEAKATVKAKSELKKVSFVKGMPNFKRYGL